MLGCMVLISSLSPSGAPWPAWSRATAASLSSAPPPPPPPIPSPAPWSPGRRWKLPSPWRRLFHCPPLFIGRLLHSQALVDLEHACTTRIQELKTTPGKKMKCPSVHTFKGWLFAQSSYICCPQQLRWAAAWAECVGSRAGEKRPLESNSLILEAARPHSHTGEAVTNMHPHLHLHRPYWDNCNLLVAIAIETDVLLQPN